MVQETQTDRMRTLQLCVVAVLVLATVVSGARSGGTAKVGSSKSESGKSASWSNSKEKVVLQMISQSEKSRASSSSSPGNKAEASGAGPQNIIINMMKSSSSSDEDGEAPCTTNCDAGVSEKAQVLGPMHYSRPIGDLQGRYAPVRGSQTEAVPTAWTSPLGAGAGDISMPDLPAPDANEAKAAVSPMTAAHSGTQVDTPVVSSALDKLKALHESHLAQQHVSHKAQLHANVAAAQDRLLFIAKMQRELRYQYSELQLQHAGLRGQVQSAQLELAKLNVENPAFPLSAGGQESLALGPQQQDSNKILGQPEDNLPGVVKIAEKHSKDKKIMQMLEMIVDKMDGKIPKDLQKEQKEERKKGEIETAEKKTEASPEQKAE